MPKEEEMLVLKVNHTGETLFLFRERGSDGVEVIHLSGSLPPHREGPPLHMHTYEDEEGEVLSGTLSALLAGKVLQVQKGGRALFPKGSPHRWWNAGEEELTFRGVVKPAVDLDRFLQAVFEVVNAGRSGRPPFFYFAHVLYRHRKTQTALIMPMLLQRIVLPSAVLLGTLLGKYRGDGWPGCPSRCTGAPSRTPPNT